MTIKRYEIDHDGCGYMEHDDGDWCRWSDVEPIIAERDALKAELDSIKSVNRILACSRDKSNDEAES